MLKRWVIEVQERGTNQDKKELEIIIPLLNKIFH